jgi:hypothetical protein
MELQLIHAWELYAISLVAIVFGMCITTRDVAYINVHPGIMSIEAIAFSILAAIIVGGICFLHGYTHWPWHMLYTVGIVVLLHFMLQISGLYSSWSYTQPSNHIKTLQDKMTEGIALAAIVFCVLPLLFYILFLTWKHPNFKFEFNKKWVSEHWKGTMLIVEIMAVSLGITGPFAMVIHDRAGKITPHAALHLAGILLFVSGIYTTVYVGGAFA